jgi:hypothetical protein
MGKIQQLRPHLKNERLRNAGRLAVNPLKKSLLLLAPTESTGQMKNSSAFDQKAAKASWWFASSRSRLNGWLQREEAKLAAIGHTETPVGEKRPDATPAR